MPKSTEDLAVWPFEVDRQTTRADVLERGPCLPAEQRSELTVAVAQPERVVVAEEVAFDERAEVAATGAVRSKVEVEARLARMDGRAAALLRPHRCASQ